MTPNPLYRFPFVSEQQLHLRFVRSRRDRQMAFYRHKALKRRLMRYLWNKNVKKIAEAPPWNITPWISPIPRAEQKPIPRYPHDFMAGAELSIFGIIIP